MSQSPSLSFGPAWMRPELSRNSSQIQQLNSNGQNSFNGSKAIYTSDELLRIWQEIQNQLKREGFEEKYRQLNPIRQLIQQIEIDRQLQETREKQFSSNGYSKSNEQDPTSNLELNSKLNEISTWAKTENTGIDIAGIITNVTRSQSPFVSKPSLLSQSSFNPNNSPLDRSSSQLNFSSTQQPARSFSNHFQTQPRFQPQPELISPRMINWYYLDPNGSKQGPFDGIAMQNWLDLGYLSMDLKIRREDELNFYPLSELATSVGTYTQPFLAPLPDLNPAHHQFSNLNLEQQTIPGLFGSNTHSNGFINQPQPQAQVSGLSNFNGWSSSSNFGTQQISGRSSPWISQPTVPATNDIIPATDFRIGQSPFMNSNSGSLDQSFQNNGSINPQKNDEDIFNNLQSHVLNDVLKDVLIKEEPLLDSGAQTQEKEVPNTIHTGPTATEQRKPIEESKKSEGLRSTTTQKPKKEILKRNSQQAQVQLQQQTPAAAPAPATAHVQPSKIVTEAVKPAPKKVSSTSQLAPWAKVSSSVPTLTLDQIQQLEAEESKKQQSKDQILAAQLIANAERALLKEEKPATKALPSGASWGATNPVKTPTKSLLDIQREEAELEAAKAASLATLAEVNASSSNIAAISSALPSKNSFASIASTSQSYNDNSWTTITRKSAPKPVQQPTKINLSSSKITPDVLRSVSATSVPASSLTSSTLASSKVSPRQEFLSWCRSTLKLNKGVNKDDVLQILLMLPATSSESNEIIADTIYSNSSTMDGRRFAIEFLKRRKAVEDQVNDGLDWFDALNINPDDEDDGWDFQVVGKKNKKRS